MDTTSYICNPPGDDVQSALLEMAAAGEITVVGIDANDGLVFARR